MPEQITTTAELVAISRWVDDSLRASGRDAELLTLHRVMKTAEEVGEAFAALIGWTGANPRKGVTHDKAEVVAELLDVAVAALGAVEHLSENSGTALDLLSEKIHYIAERAGLVIHGQNSEEPQVLPSDPAQCTIRRYAHELYPHPARPTMPEQITTAAELDALPVGSVWQDGFSNIGFRQEWTLADPDEIPTERRLAIITTGMPMPEGQWKYLTSIATESYVWHVFTEVTA